jgi:hypothetical protein
MEQVSIYKIFGIDADPLFQRIQQLNPGENIFLEQAVIIKNTFGLFEILTEDEHEPASNPYSCYEKVTTILKLNQPFEEVDS